MIDAAELRRLVEAWANRKVSEHAVSDFPMANLDAIMALVEADVWRPIESAPTKGWQTYSSPEILGVDERGTQRVTQAIDTGDDEYRMGWRDPDDMEWRPTHWRPLPKEPAQ